MKSWVKSRGVQFLWLPIPATASIPFFVLILHLRLWTFGIAVFVSIFMVVMKIKGRNIPWLYRKVKTKLGGSVVWSRSIWYRRRVQRREGFDDLDIGDVGKT